MNSYFVNKKSVLTTDLKIPAKINQDYLLLPR
jgi:hypothetical protein